MKEQVGRVEKYRVISATKKHLVAENIKTGKGFSTSIDKDAYDLQSLKVGDIIDVKYFDAKKKK